MKPFDLEELLARVETVLRRYDKTQRIINVGKIRIDTLSRSVYLDGGSVKLSTKEYDLLLLLVRNQNIALYREYIFEEVWQEPYYGNTRTIDLHIQRLKKKLNLGDAVEAVYIRWAINFRRRSLNEIILKIFLYCVYNNAFIGGAGAFALQGNSGNTRYKPLF